MVEVAKPFIMANPVHQGLQGSYIAIRYLFSKHNKSDVYTQLPCQLHLNCDPDE